VEKTPAIGPSRAVRSEGKVNDKNEISSVGAQRMCGCGLKNIPMRRLSPNSGARTDLRQDGCNRTIRRI